MSSGDQEFVVVSGCGVGEEGAVDHVGESAFESAEGFGSGVAVVLSSFEVGDRVGVYSSLGDGDAVHHCQRCPPARP